ncbi:MAG TPA: response regulator transcription factor [Galbitalea sp.]|jgi:DNA-binding NarL/FixJ family response regulator|nr:response regulator transcription factor [Galbitalea sp.]
MAPESSIPAPIDDTEGATPGVVSVALVDDHEIVGVALRATIAELPGLEYAGTVATVDELLAREPKPHLVLLDLRLADGSSPVRNVELLTDAGIRVLGYTSGESPFLVRAAAGTAMLGIIRKSESVATLSDALQKAAHNEPVVSADWASALDTDPALKSAGLSAQEQRVLTLFAGGVKAQVVASEVGIALGTVDDYVRRIRAKYERIQRPAHTKIDLYKRAVEDGFLPLPDRSTGREDQ